ncbi:MAG: hypothetical protein HQL53_03745 [Magnetococcales bacterium]|nr:hypothetical protein [Magnetococcales bacterium]
MKHHNAPQEPSPARCLYPSWYLFRLPNHQTPGGSPQNTPQGDHQTEDEPIHPMRCTACGHGITFEHHRMAVDGKHDHTFFNPHGAVFHLGCFDQAHGCQVIGTPSNDFTWFAGYAWSLALCGGCQAHLGWQFDGVKTGNEGRFYALILGKIRPGQD